LILAGSLASQEAPAHAEQVGSSVVFGAGVGDFATAGLRDITGRATTWEARFLYGTRRTLGFEAAYAGSAQSAHAPGMDPSSAVVSNGLEVDLRFNALPGPWQPYAFLGLGWRRYEIWSIDDVFVTEKDHDDVVEVPLGAGVACRFGSLVLDVRGAFRLAQREEPMSSMSGPATGGARRLDTIGLTAHVGWEL
jgi:hypothetical protein